MISSAPPTVAFVDDHPAILDSLTAAFERRNWAVLYTDVTVRAVAQRLKDSIPDVLVMDLHVGSEDGIELIRLFLKQYPAHQVLVYSQLSDAITVREAVEAGAKGYVLKDYKTDVVVEAAEKLLQGGTFYSSELVSVLVQSMTNGNGRKPLLTDQEMKVLNMIAEGGQPLKQIAINLNIQYTTVAKHRQSLLEKLEAKDDVEILHRAFALGFINLRRIPNR